MAETFLYFGPPGSGKSTEIVRQANRAVETYSQRNGCDPEDCRDVLVTSLTRAAKGEIRKRKKDGLLLDPSCVSTLHSLAVKAMDRPKLIYHKDALLDWNNSACRDKPEWTLRSLTSHAPDQRDDVAESRESCRSGDRIYEEVTKLRAKLVPQEEWPTELALFHDHFQSWKRLNDTLDFQDCIEQAADESPCAPGNPSVIFVDEAQDHDKSQFRLLQRWAEKAEKLIVVGDPLQAIFTWRGSDPDAFYELPCAWKRTLPYPSGPTWRIPAAVHHQALAVAREIDSCEQGRNRMAMDYRPRSLVDGSPEYTAEGFARRSPVSFTYRAGAEAIIADARQYLEEGRTVMFLASCAYQLKPLTDTLQERGIPYHNPFAVGNNQFNPIEYSSPGGTGRRIRDFLRPCEKLHGEGAAVWTYAQMHNWIDIVKADGLLKFRAKSKLKELADNRARRHEQITAVDLDDWLELDALTALDAAVEAGDLQWLFDRLTKGGIGDKPLRYAQRLLDRAGPEALIDQPKVIVGTVHSVKGGEADIVYVANELSRAGATSYVVDPLETLRMFYVAVTRAKEGVVLCDDSFGGAITFRWPG